MSRGLQSRHKRPTRTLGEMISTMVYIGMAGWLLLEALSLLGQAPAWQSGGLFVTASLSFLGAFRFVIAQAWARYRKGRER
jgi:hypothetical protein